MMKLTEADDFLSSQPTPPLPRCCALFWAAPMPSRAAVTLEGQLSHCAMRKKTGAGRVIGDVRCSLLVAGLGHDIGHPGFNNGFLSEV